MLLDKDLHVIYMNDWLCQRSGLHNDHSANLTLMDIFPELSESRLIECCKDAINANLPARLSNSFNPSPLPLYDPKNLGNELYRLQQTITVNPLQIEGKSVCELVVYDITTTVIKENWLKRIAANFRHQSQQKEQSLDQLSRIIENTGDAILVFTKGGEIELANASAKQLLGIQAGNAKSDKLPTLLELLPVERDEHNSTLYDRIMLTLDRSEESNNTVQIPSINTQMRSADGSRIPVDIRFSISRGKQDTKLITVIRDCSYQVQTERNFLESENRFQTLAKIAPVGIFRTCDKGIVRYANETWLRLTSCTTNELQQQSWLEFIAEDFKDKVAQRWRTVRARQGGFREEFKIKGCATCYNQTWVLCNLMAERDVFGNITGFVGTFTDITQQRANREEIERLAFNDPLTGLSNRRHFRDNLARQLKSNRRTQQPFALLAMDLDGFKIINDTYGHDAGDTVLSTIAERLKKYLRESALIGRIGGDEFSVLIPGFNHLKELITIAQRINSIIKDPIDIGVEQVTVASSIGISLYPSDADNVDDLSKNADLALYSAKANKRDPFVFFNSKMNEKAEANRELEVKLEQALEEDQFELYLQPVALNNQTENIHAESLIRWSHPEKGILQPDVFIATLEKSRLAARFSKLSFNKICRLLQQLNQNHTDAGRIKLAINLSSYQVLADKFEQTLISKVAEYNIPSTQIELEITELAIKECFSAILPVLTRLKQNGFAITLDDCSCNYLPIGKLNQLPLSTIKIERSIILDIVHNQKNQALVSAIVDIGHRLNWQVVGKGVETQEQRDALSLCGCVNCQGFLLSRPMPEQDFIDFVTTKSGKVTQFKSRNTAL